MEGCASRAFRDAERVSKSSQRVYNWKHSRSTFVTLRASGKMLVLCRWAVRVPGRKPNQSKYSEWPFTVQLTRPWNNGKRWLGAHNLQWFHCTSAEPLGLTVTRKGIIRTIVTKNRCKKWWNKARCSFHMNLLGISVSGAQGRCYLLPEMGGWEGVSPVFFLLCKRL